MTTQIFKAIEVATTNPFHANVCWWNDAEISGQIDTAVKMGLARRHSVTQVEWTEDGVAAYKAHMEDKDMVTTLPIADGKYTLITYTAESGKPAAKLVTSKGKIKWNYVFRTKELRDEYAIEMGTRIEKSEQERAENIARSQAELKVKLAAMKCGDIFYTSWGYDQTNIDFFQVVSISGKRIKVCRLENVTEETGFMCGNTKPSGKFHAYDMKERIVGITKYGNFQIDGHYTEIWDGREKSCSWYA